MAPRLADITPMRLEERRAPFSDPGWLFELKYDGYRLLAEVSAGQCTLKSRNGADATAWFPEVAAGLSTLPNGRHVLDGEVCVLDDIGRSDFDRLHERARRRGYRPAYDPVVYCAFDALVIKGRDVMHKPLSARKTALRKLLAGHPDSVLFVDGILTEGEALYAQAVVLKLEGIVGKRLDSIYRPGVRSNDWLKIKRPGAVTAERFSRKPR